MMARISSGPPWRARGTPAGRPFAERRRSARTRPRPRTASPSTTHLADGRGAGDPPGRPEDDRGPVPSASRTCRSWPADVRLASTTTSSTATCLARTAASAGDGSGSAAPPTARRRRWGSSSAAGPRRARAGSGIVAEPRGRGEPDADRAGVDGRCRNRRDQALDRLACRRRVAVGRRRDRVVGPGVRVPRLGRHAGHRSAPWVRAARRHPLPPKSRRLSPRPATSSMPRLSVHRRHRGETGRQQRVADRVGPGGLAVPVLVHPAGRQLCRVGTRRCARPTRWNGRVVWTPPTSVSSSARAQPVDRGRRGRGRGPSAWR